MGFLKSDGPLKSSFPRLQKSLNIHKIERVSMIRFKKNYCPWAMCGIAAPFIWMKRGCSTGHCLWPGVALLERKKIRPFFRQQVVSHWESWVAPTLLVVTQLSHDEWIDNDSRVYIFGGKRLLKKLSHPQPHLGDVDVILLSCGNLWTWKRK